MSMIRRLAPLVFLAALLAGCITQSTGRTPPQPSAREAAQINLQLGVSYLRQNDWMAARDKLKKAVEQDPKLAPAHRVLALVYERLGDEPAAERHYRRAVAIAPRDPDALNSLAAFLCRHDGSRDEAMALFDRALAVPLSEQDSNKAMVNTNAGVCIKPVSAERAEQYLRAALGHDPDFSLALVQMAEVALTRRNYMQSRAFLERYLSAGAPSPAALWLGVRIEQALGDTTAADDYASRLKREFPEAVETGQLLEQERNAG